MAALPGVKELAQDVFGVNVKIYVPQEMNLRIPSFAQVIGLISHITNQSEINMVVKGILDGQEALEASTNIQIINNESHKVYEQTTKQDDMPKEEKSGLFSKVFNGFKGMFNDDE